MMPPLVAEAIPLSAGRDGVVRVAGTRVTLDTVIEAFREGLSAEAIAEQYPALDLGVVYAVIGYYLRHRAEVEAYLAERSRGREAAYREMEAYWPSGGVRARLLARRQHDDCRRRGAGAERAAHAWGF